MGVCCLDEPGSWADTLEQAGIFIATLNRKPGFHPLLGRQVAEVARQYGATILHCHHYSPFVYGALAALWRPLRVIFTEHGRLADAPPSRKRRIANRVWARIPSAVFSVSDDLRSHMIAEGFSKNRVAVIRNGIDPLIVPTEDARRKARASLGLDDDQCALGAVGRLDPVKSLDTLLAAVSVLGGRLPRLRVFAIGEGTERSRLERLAAERGLEDRVRFMGHREDVRQLLPGLDLYVNTSSFEGISLTILEAMAAEVAVIATAVGGTPEVVVNRTTGLLVPPRDSDALAAAIEELVASAAQRNEFGAAGRRRVEEFFTISRMVDEYAAVYENLGAAVTETGPRSAFASVTPQDSYRA
jgi:glycosyltransferase involved in cell wall biosynthesis